MSLSRGGLTAAESERRSKAARRRIDAKRAVRQALVRRLREEGKL